MVGHCVLTENYHWLDKVSESNRDFDSLTIKGTPDYAWMLADTYYRHHEDKPKWIVIEKTERWSSDEARLTLIWDFIGNLEDLYSEIETGVYGLIISENIVDVLYLYRSNQVEGDEACLSMDALGAMLAKLDEVKSEGSI